MAEDKILVEVDKNNKEIGKAVKSELHKGNNRYHRDIQVMIFNSKGRIVLQQRSLTKSWSPGMWDVLGGHQLFGKTVEQTASDELFDGLGIKTELKLKKIRLNQDKEQSEFCYIFYGISDGPFIFDKKKVEQVKAFDAKRIINGDYDKDYKILEYVKDYLKEMTDV